MVPISKMRLPNRQGLCAGNSLLEELERSLLGLGDLGLDVVRLDVKLVRNGLHKQGVVLASERGRCRGFRNLVALLVRLFTAFGIDCRGVELLVDKSENGLK